MAKNKFLKMKIAFIISCVILGPTIIIPMIVTYFIMKSTFKTRITPTEATIDETYYKGLKKDKIAFKSGKNMLNGGLFYYEDKKPFKGLIIVSHGIGCGMNNYVNRGEFFARKGYLVMGFDMTGCGESEGDGLGGLQQGAIDLKNAILYAKEIAKERNLDVYVYGHSWSGYSAASALNYTETHFVKGVATLSGFNSFWGPMCHQGVHRVGKWFIVLKPFAYLYFLIKFKGAYNLTGMKGINKYNKPVLVMHSVDDPTVLYSYGVIAHQKECTNKNAIFHTFTDRGHTLSRPLEVEQRIQDSLEGKPVLPNDGKNVFQYNVDNKYRYCTLDDAFAIDDEYMQSVLDFFENIKEV